MTSSPPTTSSEPALLRRERQPAHVDLDGQLHLARLRCELAGAAAEPVLFREWSVERRLGHGGMGSVYLARHRQLGRWVALKILHARGDRSADMHDARLIREAQALATVDHPHVIKIHQIDVADEQTVIEIEYIEGETLRSWQTGRPWREIVAAYADAGEGIAAIHQEGLVHRDVKPDNILRGKDGAIKVADLGLAVTTHGAPSELEGNLELPPQLSVRFTAEGAVAGTLGYMAPEAIGESSPSPVSDVFSLASALYEALYGVLPFQGDTAEAHAAAIRAGTLTQKLGGPSRPRWLIACLRRALAFDPDRRQPSVREFVEELRGGLLRRRQWAWGLVSLAAAGLVGGSMWWMRGSQSEPCAAAGRHVLALWDPNVRAEIQRHVDASASMPIHRSFAVLAQSLDDSTRALASAETRLCASERSVEVAEDGDRSKLIDQNTRQRACLDHAQRHVAAIAAGVRATDSELARRYADATAAIEALPRCEDPQNLAHWSRGRDEFDELLGESLARAAALEAIGAYAEAASLAQRVARDSEGGSRVRHAEALFRLGHILGEQHRYTDSYQTLVAAREVAYGIGHDELFCQAGTFLAKLAANVGLDPSASTRELGLANACAERIGSRSIILRADLIEARGLLALAAADAPASVRWHEEALALRRDYLGAHHHHTARSVHNLANALAASGRAAEARRRYDEALALFEQTLGPGHVEVADVLYDLGEFQSHEAPEEARASLERAASIFTREPAARGLAIANIHILLALLDIAAAEPTAAALASSAEHLRHAESLLGSAPLGPNHPDRAALLRAEGALAMRRRDFRGASNKYRRATQILARHGAADPEILGCVLDEIEAAYGLADYAAIAAHALDDGELLVAHVRTIESADDRGAMAWYIGDALARQDARAKALVYLQIAYAAYQTVPRPDHVAELGWEIAKATPPEQRGEVLDLAVASRAHYQATGEQVKAQQISRWLALQE